MFGPARKTILVLVLAASLLFGVTSAQAAELVPNPGFEADCSGTPCQWSASQPNTTIARETTNPLSGASLALTMTGTPVPSYAEALSDCFPVSASTTYNVGYWYRTTAAALTTLYVGVYDYTDAGCSMNLQGHFFGASPVKTGMWTLLQREVTTSAGAQWAQFAMAFNCVGGGAGGGVCPVGTSVNFDDAVMQIEPLAVTVASLSGHKVTKGVLVRWRTGTEADLLGFHVYRSRGHSWRRLTRSLIVAKGSVSGASYRFLDKTARRGAAYRYRIKAVNRDGTTSWFGPVRVT